ncbi:MAG: type I-E CRISPR-associated protein Cas5/CasD [Candidatus Methanomethylophilaceae archaeon]|nr:type I-E CRISPR-associated protein Cas5/CasD [Candidatus Methanomethylophilaceae archaeon]
MSTLLLRLAAPLQAWGVSSKFNNRMTEPELSKSGVIGMIAAALGRRREDPIDDLAALRFGVRKDQVGTLVEDFHTAHGSGRNADFVTTRYYLSDAIFLVGLEGDGTLLSSIDTAVRNPAYPLFLGRRSCPPTGPLSLGIVETDLEDSLRNHEWLASDWYKKRCPHDVRLEIVSDAESGESASLVHDYPVSFDQEYRRHALRSVKHDLEGCTIANDRSDDNRYRTSHDAISEIRRSV